VNDTCMKLVARMILSTMTGKHKQTRDLYEKYLRERYLYVTIQEHLEAKERTA
jgi:hypothetical protein